MENVLSGIARHILSALNSFPDTADMITFGSHVKILWTFNDTQLLG